MTLRTEIAFEAGVVTDLRPDAVPVAFTVIRCPASATTVWYSEPVAFAIAFVPRYHWYFTFVSMGVVVRRVFHSSGV